MLNKISAMLDAIADNLEKKGLVKEAFEIDKVADQIDFDIIYKYPFTRTPKNTQRTVIDITEEERSKIRSKLGEGPNMQIVFEELSPNYSDYYKLVGLYYDENGSLKAAKDRKWYGVRFNSPTDPLPKNSGDVILSSVTFSGRYAWITPKK